MRIALIWKAAGVLALAAGLAFAQKPPQPKSQKELTALQAMFNEQDPDKRIAAVESLLTNFADTEFKTIALQLAASSAQQKGDFERMVVYSERTLESDPNNYAAMLMLATGLAQRTKEFDLDREEKLNRADKYANNALQLIPKAPKPRPDITDEQWAGAQKELAAQAHEALGMSATVRKKYDVAIKEYSAAIEGTPNPDPATYVRLADVYVLSNKPDDAIATLAKLDAIPNLNPAVKNVAKNVRDRAEKVKAGTMKVPANTGSAPAQVEIKK
jgi:tetratricopeptide (TPR) repeat protein